MMVDSDPVYAITSLVNMKQKKMCDMILKKKVLDWNIKNRNCKE